MDTLEQQVGYLIAKMEEQGEDIKRVVEKFDALEKRVDDKFRTAELVLKIIKFSGLALLAVLTLKFGDVRLLWSAFFG